MFRVVLFFLKGVLFDCVRVEICLEFSLIKDFLVLWLCCI